ncbi:MAG: sugar phosphate nucleotidyltransferase [Lentisphaeraceae bacterium]|nr:sugar phosphate nucleotidyltransferase [Lentisphaeraceae bacterium]
MSINLFIPAAGLGTRLRPLTNTTPKPLLPICGIPLIERIIESISNELEINQIGVNTHYLPETVNSWASESRFKEQIQLFQEDEILGTGGALKNASNLLSEKTFILANGDVIMDLDWQGLLDFHNKSGNLVTLAVQDRKHERRVGTKDNKLVCIDKTCSDPRVDHWYGYACAAVYEPDFLNELPDGESHVVPFWVDAAEKTGKVGVFDIGANNYWLDLGTPESYAQASIDCLNGESRFFREPLKIPFDCQLNKSIIIESNTEIGKNVSLENVILLSGSKVADNTTLSNAIVGPDFVKEIDWPALSASRESLDKIGNGGSDRVYTRKENCVTLHYSAFEENVSRQIELTKALLENKVSVPAVLSHNELLRTVDLEDLGDITFKQWQDDKSDSEKASMLEKVLTELKKFQFADETHCPVIKDKIFDTSVLLWETSYFFERFVQRVCDVQEESEALNQEFQKLAKLVDSLPKAIMHRDLQSENIMIQNGAPYFIDFQGAHWGTPFYDLASFLKDPYTSFPKDFRKDFEDEYLSFLGQKLNMTEDECHQAYTYCGMQRHMQALGAYGFLTHIRGKKDFIRHAKPAFTFLKEEASSCQKEFPAIYKLIQALKGSF